MQEVLLSDHDYDGNCHHNCQKYIASQWKGIVLRIEKHDFCSSACCGSLTTQILTTTKNVLTHAISSHKLYSYLFNCKNGPQFNFLAPGQKPISHNIFGFAFVNEMDLSLKCENILTISPAYDR